MAWLLAALAPPVDAAGSCCWQAIIAPCLAPVVSKWEAEWALVRLQPDEALAAPRVSSLARTGSQFAPYSRRGPSKYEHVHRDDVSHHEIGRRREDGTGLQLNRTVEVFVYEKGTTAALAPHDARRRRKRVRRISHVSLGPREKPDDSPHAEKGRRQRLGLPRRKRRRFHPPTHRLAGRRQTPVDAGQMTGPSSSCLRRRSLDPPRAAPFPDSFRAACGCELWPQSRAS
eukprot:CAMPEP_0197395916 /NCGR_PEP_ID=MMETSP1165-20131217/8137_1 /TAXON_ID=284809 /ORGANISM="Chrysocystis fragilis, Strain CCMP3189" /LENGTH=228 /DNA_ID=CAMNT_0042921709 /DNA_START=6 /DNA_END=692 /DNA_ORIENTATION=+